MVSGHLINFEKSEMTLSRGTLSDKKAGTAQILGVKLVDKHDKYLGMLAAVGKSKKEIFSVLCERIWKCINEWGEKSLSGAGKEVLIKAVLQSIPTYIMSCFQLPLYLIRSMESAIQRYWWGNGASRKMASASWAQLCKPKRCGGMGFRDLRSFNLVLLAKQCLRILTNAESLVCRLFKAKYFPTFSVLEASLGGRPSATWRSILTARNYFALGLRTRIGNG